MRLIDADKAKEVLKHQLYETAMNSIKSTVDVSQCKLIGIDMSPIYEDIAENRIDTWVDLVPTIEAEPVRHGEWILMERREPQYDIMGVKTWGVAYRCSECGFVHSVIEDFGHYVFCPNCGADMRGEQDG